MSFEGLEPVGDVRVGAWIAPALGEFGGWVGSVIPRGYPAYARVLHPAGDSAGAPASWARVCAETGRTPHARMQWTAISASAAPVVDGRPTSWPGTEPDIGNLEPVTFSRVLEVLARFTPGAADCYHAVWEGWGWLHQGAFTVFGWSGVPAPVPVVEHPAPELGPEVINGPRLRHPGRNYLLFHGPLSAALRIGHRPTPDWFIPQSPSLLWPSDRSWLLATEIDFDSTLITGPRPLIDALLADPELEAWPVDTADDLSLAGDHLNR